MRVRIGLALSAYLSLSACAPAVRGSLPSRTAPPSEMYGPAVVAAVRALSSGSICGNAECPRITFSDSVRMSERSLHTGELEFALFVLSSKDAVAVLDHLAAMSNDVRISGLELGGSISSVHISLGITMDSTADQVQTVAVSLIDSEGGVGRVFLVKVYRDGGTWRVTSVQRRNG